jgi:hypothetical protein
MFELIRDQNGVLTQIIERPSGASVPYNVTTKVMDETSPITVRFRAWEQENGQLDLSNIPVETVDEAATIRLNKLLRIDRLISLPRFPGDVNYNTGLSIGLSTETLDYFGLRVAQIFSQTIDAETYEPITPIPIVFERYKYVWESDTKLPLSRVKEIQFYLEDGSLTTEKKLLPKEFPNTSDRANITYQRRKTILNWLIARSKELGLGTALEGFFANYKDQCDRYILYENLELLDLIENATEPWLDIDSTTVMGTVRQACLLCFSKALEPTPNEEVDSYLASILV